MSSPLSGSSSPLSSLSSVPDDEPMPPFMLDNSGVGDTEASSSEVEDENPKYQREASPPHEETLADNPDIAFITMFRARFSDAFSQKLIHFGPQDIERGVVDSTPSPQVEQLLCALLALVLNRKKPIENGHYGRALEEALAANRGQWPGTWKGVNPISGGRTFNSMDSAQRLDLLRALIMWSLHESEVVSAIVKDAYKQSRQADDLNVPLSVQPWGKDELKRRYWLIEGRDDTDFRLYRENNPVLKNATWRSVAGSIDELKQVVDKLEKDKAQASRRLAQRITMAIPRFEASEEKRRRREYRLARKAAFTRPEPGFSLYEGRTRGKRARYTYDEVDDDDDLSEALSTRRSTRNSGVATPADQGRPTTTLSGRQVRSRVGGTYGETLHSGQNTDARPSPGTDASDEPVRASRSGRAGVSNRRVDDDNDTSSEGEWDGGDEDEPDEPDEIMDDLDDEGEPSENEMSEEELDRSLVVTLRYGKGRSPSLQPPSAPKPAPVVEVIIPKPSPLSKVTNVTPDSSATTTNGYPTPASIVSGTHGSTQPTPLRASTGPPTTAQPPLANVVLLKQKQTQLPFQPLPQHGLQPAASFQQAQADAQQDQMQQ